MPISLRHHRDSKFWALSAGDVSIWPMGPAGGSGGTWFNDVADQRLNIPTVSVLRVEGRHGDTLDSLSVTYQSKGLSAGPSNTAPAVVAKTTVTLLWGEEIG